MNELQKYRIRSAILFTLCGISLAVDGVLLYVTIAEDKPAWVALTGLFFSYLCLRLAAKYRKCG